jgi:protein-S-isoprenylcysteine O-methyltransferase Ste14
MSAWRQLRAIALLPGIGVGLVPAILVALGGTSIGWGLDGMFQALPIVAGAAAIGVGLLLMKRTISLFVREGRGTLAPWDPTRRLVVRGPYRHVRNPMITGVTLILLGEAALFGSVGVLIWCLAFFTINAVYFPLVEEPGLRERFGDEYECYRRNVPRWIPRRRPWTPGRS